MAANFYNDNGRMIGADFHAYWFLVPPVPVEDPTHPHVVYAAFNWALKDEKKRARTVTSERKPMMQKAAAVSIVVHAPIPAPPPAGLIEVKELALIHLGAGTAPLLGAGAVTGQGAPLAVCVEGWLGVNLNCQCFSQKLPTGGVYQPNSVTTAPTLADYADAYIDFEFDNAIGQIARWISSSAADALKDRFKNLIAEPFRILLKNKIKDLVKDLAKKVTRPIQEKIKKAVRDLL